MKQRKPKYAKKKFHKINYCNLFFCYCKLIHPYYISNCKKMQVVFLFPAKMWNNLYINAKKAKKAMLF